MTKNSRPGHDVLFALILLAPTKPMLGATNDDPCNVATNSFCFNYVDTSLNEIVQAFADEVGRTVKSWPPTRNVTLDCGRDSMSFDLALMRLQMVIFSADQHVLRLPRWECVIEAVRLRDTCCHPPLERIFLSVEAFASHPAPDHLWTMLIHDFRAFLPEILDRLRHFVPSYVYMVPYPHKAALIIWAADIDVRHYSPLLDMLEIALRDDAAVVEEITLQRAEPIDLAYTLVSLYPDTIVYRPLGAKRQIEPPGAEPDIRIWTDWAHRRAVVAGTVGAVERARELARILDTPASEK